VHLLEIICDTLATAFDYYGIDWLATGCGLVGVFLLGNKNKIGFALFMVASASWVTFGFLTHSVAVVLGSSIFFLMHMRGLIRWTRQGAEG
jgi:hypothetical protein